jgi:hypothetical protein
MAVEERTLGRTLIVIIRPRRHTGHSRKQRPVSRCASNSSFSSTRLTHEVASLSRRRSELFRAGECHAAQAVCFYNGRGKAQGTGNLATLSTCCSCSKSVRVFMVHATVCYQASGVAMRTNRVLTPRMSIVIAECAGCRCSRVRAACCARFTPPFGTFSVPLA